MMISHEQARAAAIRLQNTDDAPHPSRRPDVSDEVFAAAMAAAQSAPDTNLQRMAGVEHYRSGGCADSRVIASMMIQRIISDSLR